MAIVTVALARRRRRSSLEDVADAGEAPASECAKMAMRRAVLSHLVERETNTSEMPWQPTIRCRPAP